MKENPLRREHLDALNRALDRITKTKEIVEAAKRADLDTSRAEEELLSQEKLAIALKREFFPGEP